MAKLQAQFSSKCAYCKKEDTLYRIPIGDSVFYLCPVCVEELDYYRVLYPADTRLTAIKKAQA